MWNFLHFLSCLLLYSHLRHAIHTNDIIVVNEIWKVSWPIFFATNKIHYAQLSLYVQHVLANVNPGKI